jgi:hypothetical protein
MVSGMILRLSFNKDELLTVQSFSFGVTCRRAEPETHSVTRLSSLPHLVPKIRVNGQNENFDERPAIQRYCIRVDSLFFVVNSSLPGLGIPLVDGSTQAGVESLSITHLLGFR